MHIHYQCEGCMRMHSAESEVKMCECGVDICDDCLRYDKHRDIETCRSCYVKNNSEDEEFLRSAEQITKKAAQRCGKA